MDNIKDKLLALQGTIQSLNEELAAQRAKLGQMNAELQGTSREFKAANQTLLGEIKALRRQNQSVYDALAQVESERSESGVKPLTNYDVQTPDGKMIFGGDEFVYVKEADATIAARVDSGAAVSSISAKNITRFERDGKSWVRFDIEANDRIINVEAPFVRTTRVQQSQSEELNYRPVVKLNIKIGDYSTSSEFNLIDRTRMQYALLLGRSLLTDIAVIDVSRRYIQPRADKDGLVILKIDDYAEAIKQGKNPNESYDARMLNNAAGQTAYPSHDYGANLGTDSYKALPAVADKLNKNQDRLTDTKVPADDKNAPNNGGTADHKRSGSSVLKDTELPSGNESEEDDAEKNDSKNSAKNQSVKSKNTK
ncbi:MAG: ATP-dependent zinc protease [Succinivibrio sp.]|nr:ATP-dependent zinc protease [Succinivibrio sp.]